MMLTANNNTEKVRQMLSKNMNVTFRTFTSVEFNKILSNFTLMDWAKFSRNIFEKEHQCSSLFDSKKFCTSWLLTVNRFGFL